MKGERSSALDRRVQEGCRQASAVLPGGRRGAKIRKSVKRELETSVLEQKRPTIPGVPEAGLLLLDRRRHRLGQAKDGFERPRARCACVFLTINHDSRSRFGAALTT